LDIGKIVVTSLSTSIGNSYKLIIIKQFIDIKRFIFPFLVNSIISLVFQVKQEFVTVKLLDLSGLKVF